MVGAGAAGEIWDVTTSGNGCVYSGADGAETSATGGGTAGADVSATMAGRSSGAEWTGAVDSKSMGAAEVSAAGTGIDAGASVSAAASVRAKGLSCSSRYSAVILSSELDGTLAVAMPSSLALASTDLLSKPSFFAKSYIRTGILYDLTPEWKSRPHALTCLNERNAFP